MPRVLQRGKEVGNAPQTAHEAHNGGEGVREAPGRVLHGGDAAGVAVGALHGRRVRAEGREGGAVDLEVLGAGLHGVALLMLGGRVAVVLRLRGRAAVLRHGGAGVLLLHRVLVVLVLVLVFGRRARGGDVVAVGVRVSGGRDVVLGRCLVHGAVTSVFPSVWDWKLCRMDGGQVVEGRGM